MMTFFLALFAIISSFLIGGIVALSVGMHKLMNDPDLCEYVEKKTKRK